MALGPLPISRFTAPDGSALSYGFVLLQLNKDAQSSGSQICAGSVVRIDLDENGVPVGAPTFPTNASMVPSNTIYLVSAYRANGVLVYRYLPVTVVAPPVVMGFGMAFGVSFGS